MRVPAQHMRFLAHLVGVASLMLMPQCYALDGQESHSEAWQSINAHRKLTASSACEFNETADGAVLKSGALMVDSKNAYSIRSNLAVVAGSNGSLLFARILPDCEHVFVLLGSAKLIVGNHTTSMRAGEEAAVADHNLNAKELLGEDFVGRRRLRMVKLDDDKAMSLSEFSIIQAVEREPELYRLFHSTDPRDKAAKERLLKEAAILNFVTGSHGPYTNGLR